MRITWPVSISFCIDFFFCFSCVRSREFVVPYLARSYRLFKELVRFYQLKYRTTKMREYLSKSNGETFVRSVTNAMKGLRK